MFKASPLKPLLQRNSVFATFCSQEKTLGIRTESRCSVLEHYIHVEDDCWPEPELKLCRHGNVVARNWVLLHLEILFITLA